MFKIVSSLVRVRFTCFYHFRYFMKNYWGQVYFLQVALIWWKFQFPKFILCKKWINQKLNNIMEKKNIALLSYISAPEKVQII